MNVLDCGILRRHVQSSFLKPAGSELDAMLKQCAVSNSGDMEAVRKALAAHAVMTAMRRVGESGLESTWGSPSIPEDVKSILGDKLAPVLKATEKQAAELTDLFVKSRRENELGADPFPSRSGQGRGIKLRRL